MSASAGCGHACEQLELVAKGPDDNYAQVTERTGLPPSPQPLHPAGRPG